MVQPMSDNHGSRFSERDALMEDIRRMEARRQALAREYARTHDAALSVRIAALGGSITDADYTLGLMAKSDHPRQRYDARHTRLGDGG